MLEPGEDVADAGLQRREGVRGAQVPPDLGAVLDHAEGDDRVYGAAVLGPAGEVRRQAGARQVVEDREPVAGEAGIGALPVGRGGGEREQVREEVAELAHQVAAQRVVVDPDMDVHPADQHAARDAGEVALEDVVAVLVGRDLVAPVGEGVAGGSDGHEAVPRGVARDAGAQLAQFLAGGADVAAHPGADLDLALQELGADAVLELGAAGVHQRLGRVGEVHRLTVDEEVLLLDAEGERRGGAAHDGSGFLRGAAR